MRSCACVYVLAIDIMEPFVESGYTYQFTDKPLDLLICKICHLVSQDPHETTCCHNTFCKPCIDAANRHGFKSCPLCRHQPVQTIECVQLHRQIKSLHVFCDNKEIGCEWIGQVDAVKRHMNQCPYSMVTCDYHMVGCTAKIPLHLLSEHYGEKEKDHVFLVQLKVEELEITKVMLQQANEALNGTKQEVKRNKELLDIATVELQHTKAKLHDTTEKLNVSQTELHNTNKQLNRTLDHLAHSQEETKDTQTQLTDSEAQLNDTIKQLLYSNQKLEVTENETAVVVSSLKQIKNHVKNNCYEAIKLEALSTKIPSEVKVVPAVFKITQYMEKKENNLKWYSDLFYKGYRMCLRVSPGGVGKGKGTHLSVALCLMHGPHDDYLTWPLRETFKVTLLNQQLQDDRNHTMTISYDDRVSDEIADRVVDNDRAGPNQCAQFISHSEIMSSRQFLVDDCMYFQVEVDKNTVVHTSTCKYIFVIMFSYYIVLSVGMILLQ